MQAEPHAKGLEILISVFKRAEMLHFFFGKTRDGLKSRVRNVACWCHVVLLL